MTKQEYQREQNRRRHELAKPAYNALMKYYPFTLEDLPDEEWRIIDEHYHVSNFGRVKSFWGKMPKILKPFLSIDYFQVSLSIGGERKWQKIHLLVARAFIPNPEGKPEVNHEDGNKFNCHVSNLYWATKSENQQHAYDTGLRVNLKGEESHNAKLQNPDIIYIRDNPDNLTGKELAVKFGVTETTISDIQRGKKYQDAGGTVRKTIRPRVSDNIRCQIGAEWATGNFTQQQLSEQYGLGQATISRIIRAGVSTGAN